MTKNEYKEQVTSSVVREVFERDIFYPERRNWAMFICGRMISIGGKCFYESREQAVKALYNSMGWKAKRALWEVTHPEDDRYGYWRQPEAGTMWRAFKEAITEKYGFKVIQV